MAALSGVAALANAQSVGCVGGFWNYGTMVSAESSVMVTASSEAECLAKGLEAEPAATTVTFVPQASRCMVTVDPTGSDGYASYSLGATSCRIDHCGDTAFPAPVNWDTPWCYGGLVSGLYPDPSSEMLGSVYDSDKNTCFEKLYAKYPQAKWYGYLDVLGECTAYVDGPVVKPLIWMEKSYLCRVAPDPTAITNSELPVASCNNGWRKHSFIMNGEVILTTTADNQTDCFAKAVALLPEAAWANYIGYSVRQCIVYRRSNGEAGDVQSDDQHFTGYWSCMIQPIKVPALVPAQCPTSAPTTARPKQCKPTSWYCNNVCAGLGYGSSCKSVCVVRLGRKPDALKQYCEECRDPVAFAQADEAEAAVATLEAEGSTEASLLQRMVPAVVQAVAPEVLLAQQRGSTCESNCHYCKDVCEEAIGEDNLICAGRCIRAWDSMVKPVLDEFCRSGICQEEEAEESTSLLQTSVASLPEL